MKPFAVAEDGGGCRRTGRCGEPVQLQQGVVSPRRRPPQRMHLAQPPHAARQQPGVWAVFAAGVGGGSCCDPPRLQVVVPPLPPRLSNRSAPPSLSTPRAHSVHTPAGAVGPVEALARGCGVLEPLLQLRQPNSGHCSPFRPCVVQKA